MTSSFFKMIIASLLTLVLFLPEGLVYSWLKLKQKEIRREVKHRIHAGLEKNDLLRLSFHVNDEKSAVSWVKKGEFSYKNSMFDVVFQETSADSIIYYCWEDYEENIIKKQLQKLSALAWENQPERRDGHKKVFDFYKQLFFQEPESISTFRYNPDSETITVMNYNYVSAFFYSESPPPELNLSSSLI